MTHPYPKGINNAWTGRREEIHCYELNAKEAREKQKRRAEKPFGEDCSILHTSHEGCQRYSRLNPVQCRISVIVLILAKFHKRCGVAMLSATKSRNKRSFHGDGQSFVPRRANRAVVFGT